MSSKSLLGECRGWDYLSPGFFSVIFMSKGQGLSSLELMRYVYTDLWNNPEYKSEGPLRLTEAVLQSATPGSGNPWAGPPTNLMS